MINERASDRINFLSFYVSLASGSTCSLAGTLSGALSLELAICVSTAARALHQATHKAALLSVKAAGKTGCQGFGKKHVTHPGSL